MANEIDNRLIPYLKELKNKYHNLEIINASVLDTTKPIIDLENSTNFYVNNGGILLK